MVLLDQLHDNTAWGSVPQQQRRQKYTWGPRRHIKAAQGARLHLHELRVGLRGSADLHPYTAPLMDECPACGDSTRNCITPTIARRDLVCTARPGDTAPQTCTAASTERVMFQTSSPRWEMGSGHLSHKELPSSLGEPTAAAPGQASRERNGALTQVSNSRQRHTGSGVAEHS